MVRSSGSRRKDASGPLKSPIDEIRRSFGGGDLDRAAEVLIKTKALEGMKKCLVTRSPYAFLQLHVVHYDSESYGSLSEAAQKPQGLAVLGILIEVSNP